MQEQREEKTPHRRKRQDTEKGSGIAMPVVAVLVVALIAAGAFAARLHSLNGALQRDKEALQRELARYDGGFTAEEHAEIVAREKGLSRDEVLQYIKDEMSSGRRGPLDTVRSLFPDEIVLFYEDGYVFQPLDKTLPANEFAPDDFALNENGFLEYTGTDMNVRTFPGIDVSSHQGYIDWAQVAASGVRFAMIRVGFRGWGITGSLNLDERFVANVTGAYENGIEVGVYWFPASLDTREAEEEADFVIEAIEPYRHMITWPVALDLELPETTQSRVYGQPKEVVTDNALAFLKKIEEAGYDTMVYGNLTTYVVMAEPARLADYPTWIAWYDLPMYYPYRFQIWQYTAQGRVDGISTEVDLNLGFLP